MKNDFKSKPQINYLVKKLLVLSFFILSLMSSFAKADNRLPELWCPQCPWCGPCGFWGADFKYGIMHGKGDWKPDFPKEYLGGNIYAGISFHPNFGISAGYDRTVRPVAHRSFGTLFNHDLSGVKYNRALILRIWHADLEYYVPICGCLQGVGSVGVGYLNPLLTTSAVSGPSTDISKALANLRLSKPGIMRVRAGIQWHVYEFLWLRGQVGFDNTARMKVVRDSARILKLHDIPINPISDMFSASLGFMVKFGL